MSNAPHAPHPARIGAARLLFGCGFPRICPGTLDFRDGNPRAVRRARLKENMRMKLSGIAMLGGAGIVLAGIATAPIAGAAPCSAAGATGTIGSVSTAASQYLAGHPGADQTLSTAISQSPDDARASVRAYFTAHPNEYFDLQGIVAPLKDLRGQCGVSVTPSQLALLLDGI